VALNTLQTLQYPVDFSMQEANVSCSSGITSAPDDSMNAGALMRYADLAM
jgi:predicted signal transduction protein with EAL and GGDEF domain